MDCFDIREAGEVSRVEGEDALDAVDMHGGDQAGVMDLDAGDAMRHKQLAPFLMYIETIGKQSDSGFDGACPAVGLCRRQAKSIAINRAGEDVPEFAEILRSVTRIGLANQKAIHCCSHVNLIRVVWLLPAKQNVAVEQYQHQRALWMVLIDALPAERRGGEFWKSLGVFSQLAQHGVKLFAGKLAR